MSSVSRCRERLLQLRQLCPVDDETDDELAASVQLCLLRFQLNLSKEEYRLESKVRNLQQKIRDLNIITPLPLDDYQDSSPTNKSSCSSHESICSISEALQLVLDLVNIIPPRHPVIDQLDVELGLIQRRKVMKCSTTEIPPLPSEKTSIEDIIVEPKIDEQYSNQKKSNLKRHLTAPKTIKKKSTSTTDGICNDLCFDLSGFGGVVNTDIVVSPSASTTNNILRRSSLTSEEEDSVLGSNEYLLKREIRARWYSATTPMLDTAGRSMPWIHPYNTTVLTAASRVVRNTFWMHVAREERFKLRERERDICIRQKEIEAALLIQNMFRLFTARRLVSNRRIIAFEDFNSEMNELLAGLVDDCD